MKPKSKYPTDIQLTFKETIERMKEQDEKIKQVCKKDKTHTERLIK